MTILYRKPQKLILQEIVSPVQEYCPTFPINKVLPNSLSLEMLSDRFIDGLVEAALKEDSLKTRGNKKPALVEGILDDKKYGLGRLVVSIQYDYSKNGPFIEVPGKYRDVIYGDGGEPLGISVLLLTTHEQIAFIERILKKSHELNGGYTYTGDYLIWPGCMEPNALKRRKIKI